MRIDPTCDYHMHSTFSDGTASIDDMALSAIEKGLSQIAVTDHMPLPFDTRYAMNREKTDQYKLAVKNAQAKYSGQLKIHMGIEIEFIPHIRFWVHSISKMGWDISIASVHSLYVDNLPGLVNGTRKEFDGLFKRFEYDIRALCRSYYETVQMACQTGWFDIAGHLDVVKKHNAGQVLFDESEPWYRGLVIETLDVIKHAGMKLEINTAGFNHPVKEQYPSRWIIEKAIEQDIPIVLGSDSHSSETPGQYFDAMIELVDQSRTIDIDTEIAAASV